IHIPLINQLYFVFCFRASRINVFSALSLHDALPISIVAGTLPCAKVAEDATTFAFMDIDPGADGHLLVIPKQHSADLVEVSADDLAATTLAAQRIAIATLSELGADGVNLLNCCGAEAWQTVFHFHLHVIPRYHDKTKMPL